MGLGPVNLPFGPHSRKLIGAHAALSGSQWGPSPGQTPSQARGQSRAAETVSPSLFSARWSQPTAVARDLADVNSFERKYKLASWPDGKDSCDPLVRT